MGPQFKRNIRYDDANRTLVMDIKYPGEDSKWERLTYDEAVHGNRMAGANPATINALASRIELPRNSPASKATPRRSSQPSASGWNQPVGQTPGPPNQGGGQDSMDEDEVWTSQG